MCMMHVNDVCKLALTQTLTPTILYSNTKSKHTEISSINKQFNIKTNDKKLRFVIIMTTSSGKLGKNATIR